MYCRLLFYQLHTKIRNLDIMNMNRKMRNVDMMNMNRKIRNVDMMNMKRKMRNLDMMNMNRNRKMKIHGLNDKNFMQNNPISFSCRRFNSTTSLIKELLDKRVLVDNKQLKLYYEMHKELFDYNHFITRFFLKYLSVPVSNSYANYFYDSIQNMVRPPSLRLDIYHLSPPPPPPLSIENNTTISTIMENPLARAKAMRGVKIVKILRGEGDSSFLLCAGSLRSDFENVQTLVIHPIFPTLSYKITLSDRSQQSLFDSVYRIRVLRSSDSISEEITPLLRERSSSDSSLYETSSDTTLYDWMIRPPIMRDSSPQGPPQSSSESELISPLRGTPLELSNCLPAAIYKTLVIVTLWWCLLPEGFLSFISSLDQISIFDPSFLRKVTDFLNSPASSSSSLVFDPLGEGIKTQGEGTSKDPHVYGYSSGTYIFVGTLLLFILFSEN